MWMVEYGMLKDVHGRGELGIVHSFHDQKCHIPLLGRWIYLGEEEGQALLFRSLWSGFASRNDEEKGNQVEDWFHGSKIWKIAVRPRRFWKPSGSFCPYFFSNT